MPIISQFYGIIIKMYFKEGEKHHKEHIHIIYNEYSAVYNFDGQILEGELPNKQKKLVEAWIAIHEEELKILWKKIKTKGEYYKIEPLK